MKLVLAAAAAVALAHEWIECPEGDPLSPEVARCLTQRAEEFHREPKWVKEFSVAASGPEQIWINYYDSPDSMAVRYISSNTNSKPGVQVGIAYVQRACVVASHFIISAGALCFDQNYSC